MKDPDSSRSNDTNASSSPESQRVNDELVFDLVEAVMHKLRAGCSVDVREACASFPHLAARVQELVRHAALSEGLDLSGTTLPFFRVDSDNVAPDTLTFAQEPTVFTRNDDNTPVALPNYIIVREIARGGMGVVYEARQLKLKRTVALKMMLPADSTGIHRFLAEAEAVAAVQHPNVVQVFESGEQSERPYIVMEYCSGGTLADRLRNSAGPIAPRMVVQLMEQIAAGVAEAHNQGIVHRDLKPGNVLFDEKGIPKVADFGLAKRESGTDLTLTQGVVGTPAYMSPEQARGEGKFVGPAVDVWALGAILYECLTGRRAFQGENVIAILEKIKQNQLPRVRSLVPNVPRDVELIVHKCLAAEPRDRYQTAKELSQDLNNWLDGRPVTARPVGILTTAYKWARRNPSRAALVLMSILVLIGLELGWVLYQERLLEARIAAQVDRLTTAAPSDVAALRLGIAADRGRAEPLVRAMLAQARQRTDRRTELNAALVLVSWDRDEIDRLLDRALTAGPDETLAVRDALSSFPSEVTTRLRPVLADTARPLAQRLRALALVVAMDPNVPRQYVEEVAPQLLVEDRLQLSSWIQALKPASEGLTRILSEKYLQRLDTDAGVGAALVLREYLKGDPVKVVPLVSNGGWRQAFLLGAALRNHAEGVKTLRSEFDRINYRQPDGPISRDNEEGGTIDAKRRAAVGLALLAADDPITVWRALAMSDEPQLRTYLIHAFAAAGVPPQLLVGGLSETNPTIRQALYLAWGEYEADVWSAAEFERIIVTVLDDFVNSPDPGVHSAADWLLRRWHQQDRLVAARESLPKMASRGARNWFTNSEGMTFAVVPGPVETRIGTHFGDWGYDPTFSAGLREPVHRRRIGRAYAIATTEVTLDQMKRFAKEHPEGFAVPVQESWSVRTGDSPVAHIDWFAAARYCRWLGEKEGIPESQQCYPKLDEIKPGMTLDPDHVNRTGYRLPTESEWEHACRVGSRTHYWFGSDEASISAHAWWVANSRFQTQPVGQLKPNPMGLFDIHGNAFERCTQVTHYPAEDQIEPILDDRMESEVATAESMSTLRGGDFPAAATRQQSRHRTAVARNVFWPASGLRLARTISVPNLDVFRVKSDGARSVFAVRGAVGNYRVLSVTKGVNVSTAEGSIPGEFEVTSSGQRTGRYKVALERVDTGEQTEISDEFIPAEWKVRWYSWERSPIKPDDAPVDSQWEKAISRPPLRESNTAKLEYWWNQESNVDGVPGSYLGLVATSMVTVAGGMYRLEGMKPSGAFRVTLNGSVVLHQGWPGRVNRPTTVLDLPAGKHEIKVEAIHIFGPAHFEFQIRPVEKTAPPHS